jgi:hypothetical protein
MDRDADPSPARRAPGHRQFLPPMTRLPLEMTKFRILPL